MMTASVLAIQPRVYEELLFIVGMNGPAHAGIRFDGQTASGDLRQCARRNLKFSTLLSLTTNFTRNILNLIDE